MNILLLILAALFIIVIITLANFYKSSHNHQLISVNPLSSLSSNKTPEIINNSLSSNTPPEIITDLYLRLVNDPRKLYLSFNENGFFLSPVKQSVSFHRFDSNYLLPSYRKIRRFSTHY